MDRIINYIRGNVRIRVSCTYPERFLNICAQSGIEFWDMERQDDDLVFTTHYEDYQLLRKRSYFANYKIKSVRKTGTSFFLWRLRKRYALLAGMILCLCLVWISSMFIWEINVSGNETVSTAEILTQLEQLGVGIGTFRMTLSQDYISNEMLLRVPELCWITVNTKGSRADVRVREEIPTPEIVEEDVPTLVFAKKAGIIEKMTVLEGAKMVAVGDTVVEGDTLVTGAMESLSTGTRFVHAMGDIYARTWYTESAQLMDEANAKEYTGREKTKVALTFGGNRINLYLSGGVDWEKYDKSSNERKLSLFGIVLPIGIVRETYVEYTVKPAKLGGIEETLKNRLTEKLEDELEKGEITWSEFSTSSNNGITTVTMTAECIEQIGAIRRLTDEEMIQTVPENDESEVN